MSRIGAMLLGFGVSFPQGHSKMKALFSWLATHAKEPLPPRPTQEPEAAQRHYLHLNGCVAKQDKKVKAWAGQGGRCRLVKTIPGVGGMAASQLIMEAGNAQQFKNGREMAAWFGAQAAPNRRKTALAWYQ